MQMDLKKWMKMREIKPMDMERKNPTITDIARAAGVSKTTVSRYINGKFELMSAQTRERIAAVIAMSNYRPNSIAQSLKARQSFQVGVVVSDISSPFSAALIRGIGHVLLEEGYVPLFADSKCSLDVERRMIETLVSRKVDGLIVNTSDCNNPSLIQLACQGMPVVLCDRHVNDYHFAFVGSEKRAPMLELVRHLKEEGFARTALFTEPYAANSARLLRRKAFLEGAAEHYPELDEKALCTTIDLSDSAATVRALERLLSECSAGEVPAVVGINSVTTMHVIAAIHSMGLSIPKQIGVCGPNDWGWDAQIDWPSIITPGITTITVHPYEIGCAVARALLKRIAEPEAEKTEELIASELVIRGSTRLSEKA